MKKAKTYSESIEKILEVKDRIKKGKRIIKIIEDSIGDLSNKKCLDLGCSSGVITDLFSKKFKSVVGIDNDAHAIDLAKKAYKSKNLSFITMKGEKLDFPNETFDVVICAQVYNSVSDAKSMVKEIRRVLKADGICFFSGRNKYALVERQYDLPFLSWLPTNLGNMYVKLMGKGDYFIGSGYLDYWQLKSLFKNFEIEDYTIKILENPKKFGFSELIKLKLISRYLNLKVLLPVVPNYIWILRKK